LSWVRRHVEAGDGEWVDGVFHFHLQPQAQCSPRSTAPEMRASRPPSLVDLLAVPDHRTFVCDPSYWDGRAVLRWWPDQGYHAMVVVPGKAIVPADLLDQVVR
jgi:hypothetical protein